MRIGRDARDEVIEKVEIQRKLDGGEVDATMNEAGY